MVPVSVSWSTPMICSSAYRLRAKPSPPLSSSVYQRTPIHTDTVSEGGQPPRFAHLVAGRLTSCIGRQSANLCLGNSGSLPSCHHTSSDCRGCTTLGLWQHKVGWAPFRHSEVRRMACHYLPYYIRHFDFLAHQCRVYSFLCPWFVEFHL